MFPLSLFQPQISRLLGKIAPLLSPTLMELKFLNPQSEGLTQFAAKQQLCEALCKVDFSGLSSLPSKVNS